MEKRIYCRKLGEFVTVSMDMIHDRDVAAATLSIASADGGLMEGTVLGVQVSVAHHAMLDGDLDLLARLLPDDQPPPETLVQYHVDRLIAELAVLAAAQINVNQGV